MMTGNSISTDFPSDFPDRAKYITTTDTAFVAWLDMNHGIRPVALVIDDKKGIWCLPLSHEDQKGKWMLFKESEYYRHHVKHREYLRLLHEIMGNSKEAPRKS